MKKASDQIKLAGLKLNGALNTEEHERNEKRYETHHTKQTQTTTNIWPSIPIKE